MDQDFCAVEKELNLAVAELNSCDIEIQRLEGRGSMSSRRCWRASGESSLSLRNDTARPGGAWRPTGRGTRPARPRPSFVSSQN